MKFKIIIISIILISIGCIFPTGTSEPEFENYKYPLKVGNSWIYEKTLTYSNVRPDTLQLWFPLVMKGSAVVEVYEIDFVGDSLELYLLTAFAVDSLNPQFGDSSTFLFGNEEDGLFEYANSGSNLAVPISRPPTELELKNYLNNNLKVNNTNLLSLNDTPKQSLKYPIQLNSEWMFIDSTNFIFGIDKKVIRFQELETKVGSLVRTYKCFVVEWIYSKKDISVIDYYSKIGLMKRTIIAKDITQCPIGGGDCFSFDMTEEYNLVEFMPAPELP